MFVIQTKKILPTITNKRFCGKDVMFFLFDFFQVVVESLGCMVGLRFSLEHHGVRIFYSPPEETCLVFVSYRSDLKSWC